MRFSRFRRSWSSTNRCSYAQEVYDVGRLDFAEAYLVASAEATGVGAAASFDRDIDRIVTVRRLAP